MIKWLRNEIEKNLSQIAGKRLMMTGAGAGFVTCMAAALRQSFIPRVDVPCFIVGVVLSAMIYLVGRVAFATRLHTELRPLARSMTGLLSASRVFPANGELFSCSIPLIIYAAGRILRTQPLVKSLDAGPREQPFNRFIRVSQHRRFINCGQAVVFQHDLAVDDNRFHVPLAGAVDQPRDRVNPFRRI